MGARRSRPQGGGRVNGRRRLYFQRRLPDGACPAARPSIPPVRNRVFPRLRIAPRSKSLPGGSPNYLIKRSLPPSSGNKRPPYSSRIGKASCRDWQTCRSSPIFPEQAHIPVGLPDLLNDDLKTFVGPGKGFLGLALLGQIDEALQQIGMAVFGYRDDGFQDGDPVPPGRLQQALGLFRLGVILYGARSLPLRRGKTGGRTGRQPARAGGRSSRRRKDWLPLSSDSLGR